MKPDAPDSPRVPSPNDPTDPGEPPPREGVSRPDAITTPDGPPILRDDRTIPDPVDVERLILSLERPPRPPAPIPEQRPSSDGGRFVAYGGTGRPAQPQTEQEARRQALRELSVLVNATPVPPEADQRNASTQRLRLPVSRGAVAWKAAAVLVGAAAVASVALWVTTQNGTTPSPVPLVAVAHSAPTAASLPPPVTLPPLPPPAPVREPAPPETTEARPPAPPDPPAPVPRAPPAPPPPPPPAPNPVHVYASPRTPPPHPVVPAPCPRDCAPSVPAAPSPEPAPSAKAAFDRW